MIPDAAVLAVHNLRPARRLAAGCIIAAVSYLALVGALGMAVLVVGLMHAKIIQASLMRAMQPYVLAPSLTMLDARHTAGERAAFSNAVASLFSQMESASFNSPSNWWMRDTLERLIASQKDRVILPHESSAFCSSVWFHTAPPVSSPDPSPAP